MTDDKFDLILDAALRDYSNREPRAGFEQRILRHVQTASPVRRSYWKFGWAMAAIVVALIIPRLDLPKKAPVHEISRVVKQPAPSLPPQPVPTVTKTIKKHSEPDKFPEPEPLTAEERALLRFVQDRPDLARETLSQSARIEELTIEPLEIEQLQEP
jgi:hypothetical protein